MAEKVRALSTVQTLCEASNTPYHEACFDESHSRLIRKFLESTEQWDLRTPYVYCGLVQDAHIFGRSFVYTKSGSYVFKCQSYQSHNGFMFDECAAAYIDSRADLFTDYIEDECIFLGGMNVEPTPEGSSHLLPGGTNFGHFIFEYLSRLAIFDIYGLLGRLPIVMYDFIPERWIDWLVLLGIPKDRIIRISVEKAPAFRKVWISSACHYRDSDGRYRMWASGLHWSRYQAFKAVGGPRPGAKRRIYLGRGSAKWRRVVNEPEIIEMLAGYGFEFPAMHEMSPREQIEAISGAELVVAAGGANTILTHFAPEHCSIITMYPNKLMGQGLWGGLGAAILLRQLYERIDGEIVDTQQSRPINAAGEFEFADYKVDISTLKSKVETALRIILLTQYRDAAKL
jgi:hypothetical protein